MRIGYTSSVCHSVLDAEILWERIEGTREVPLPLHMPHKRTQMTRKGTDLLWGLPTHHFSPVCAVAWKVRIGDLLQFLFLRLLVVIPGALIALLTRTLSVGVGCRVSRYEGRPTPYLVCLRSCLAEHFFGTAP